MLAYLRSFFARPAANRPAVRAYRDITRTTDDNRRHWANVDYLNADGGNSPGSRRIMRARARHEADNNSYAAGMLETVANDVIGTGPRLQLLDQNEEDASAAEVAFMDWGDDIGLAGKLWIKVFAADRDGESFGVLTNSESNATPVQLDLVLYESEQFASPLPAIDDLSDGIEFDSTGRPVRYTMLKYHPGDPRGAATSAVKIPAESVVHLYRPTRAGQSRGVPKIVPALPLYAQLRRYTLAVLSAAETAANIAGVMKTQTSPVDSDSAPEPFDAVEIERNQLMFLPEGYDISQLRAEQPTTTYSQFKRELISEIARCLNMPYNVAAGDSSSYNYSSGRLDRKTYYRSQLASRKNIERRVLLPILRAWWAEARRIPDLLPESLRKLEQPPRHAWVWDGDESIDPLKDANASKALIEAGLSTWSYELAERGRDQRTVFEQLAREKAQAEKLGLNLLPSKSAPVGSEENAVDESPAEELGPGRRKAADDDSPRRGRPPGRAE